MAADRRGAGGEYAGDRRRNRAADELRRLAQTGGAPRRRARRRGAALMQGLRDIWVYLSASPLLHLTLTLVAYQLGFQLYSRGRLNPLLNPVLVAVILIVGLLVMTGTSYQSYFEGAQF